MFAKVGGVAIVVEDIVLNLKGHTQGVSNAVTNHLKDRVSLCRGHSSVACQGEKTCCLSCNAFAVGRLIDEEVTHPCILIQLTLQQSTHCAADDLGVERLAIADQAQCFCQEVIAGKHCLLGSNPSIEGRFTPSLGSSINDVIMDKAGKVD